MFFVTQIALFLLCFKCIYCCWGGGRPVYYYEYEVPAPEMDGDAEDNYGGWPTPPGIKPFKVKTYYGKFDPKNPEAGKSDPNFPNPKLFSMPPHWVGWMGGGEGGFGGGPVPPWGYVPIHGNRHPNCFLPPKSGKKCPDSDREGRNRWGFNPYIDECMAFFYFGCEGNNNNYLTQVACQKACKLVNSECLSDESYIYVDKTADNPP